MTLTDEISQDLVPSLRMAAVPTGQNSPLSWEDFEAALDELDIRAPALPPEAYSRAALYADHD